jgi:hypothetical protein
MRLISLFLYRALFPISDEKLIITPRPYHSRESSINRIEYLPLRDMPANSLSISALSKEPKASRHMLFHPLALL